MFKFTVTSFFLTLLAVASAIVWNPTITTPTTGTKWRAGQKYTVRWNTKVDGQDIPDNVRGAIKLGYHEGNSINEHLYWDLASDFQLNKGYQTITLPKDLKTRTRYIIVLMGDSGNASKEFKIDASR
ncbi:hypothetical protein EC973_002399 [Apophysomyces ossiformis]|uniref:Yeast cell wall synthesis Kre9/Knh1-like N-terminal domain-containing protein n=1 Tax=Apophysomyces ossiformis TaxID=679940 RepID=A0A8H7BNQ2_9FUNG|nr:hypothetical protein EC973_002399 [Apophysomyces ossiformis]